MMTTHTTAEEQLRAENAELHARLEEAEDTLRAIRAGEVDALVVETADGPQIFTLQGVDAVSNRFRGELLTQVSDALIAVDADQRVTYLNAAAERQYRVSASNALGRDLSEIYTPKWPRAETEASMWTALREHGEWRDEIIHCTHDGGEIAVEISVTALRDAFGAPAGYVGVFRDITERIRCAAELQRVSGLLDTILHSAPIGFCFFDRDLRCVRINERLAEMNGIPVEAHLGRQVSEIVPTLANTIRDVTDRILETGNAVLNHEFSGETPAAPGVMRFWSESWYPVRDGAGEVLGFGAVVEEITARKQAEANQRKMQEQVEMTLESITDGFMRFDRDWRVIYVNAEAERMNQQSRSDTLGKTLWELWPAVIGTTLETEYRRAVADQVTVEFENHYEPRGLWYAIKGYPAADGGLAIYFRDITNWKRAEEALRESEERMRLATEAAATGMWDWDVSTNAVTWSAECYVVHGLRQGEFDGTAAAFDRLLHPDDRDRVWATARAAVDRREKYACEFRIIHPDGEVRWVTNAGRAVYDEQDRPLRILGTITDVTDRKRAEEALRESDERYRAATAAISDVIWTTNAAGFLAGEQQGWADFTGQSQEEYQGDGWSKVVHPEDAQPTIDEWKRAVAEKRTFVFENRVRRRDGEWRVCSIRAVPLLNADQTIREWVGVHTDVTERKRDEEKLRQLAAELSEADRRKDEFMATLAHELRNPLAPIRSGLQIIKLSGANGAVEQARTMMERQLTHMVRLVDDLLDISRVSQGKIELRTERVEVRAVIDAAVETSRPLIEEAGHNLVVVVPDEPIFVDGDMTRLVQVVSNLLTNSAKYMHRGGHIELMVSVESRFVTIRVKDEGIGIPPAMLAKVFVMFTQVDRTLEKTTGGLGIGLSLVKGLVEMHGGTIEANSDGEGKGSEFVVRLPVVIEASKPQESGSAAEQPVKSSHRILVVDDNRDGANTLAMMLKIMGNDTRTAYDGQAGVDVAGEFRPDVILLDIGLPKLNGHEACRCIREQSWGKAVVLIAVTGWGQDEDRRRSHEAGFDHHMVKPVDPQALMTMLAGLRVAKH